MKILRLALLFISTQAFMNQTVLAQGTPLVEDVPDQIKGHPKVKEAYLGESH